MPNGLGDFPNFQSVQQLLAAFYGAAFVTTPIETTPSVGTAVSAIGSKPGGVRVGVFVSNTSVNNIAVGFNPAITITTGIVIFPGGTASFDWYYDGDLVSRPLYAIAAAAASTLYVLERFLQGA